MFRTLVKEGTVVESRASASSATASKTSITQANAMWKQTRRTVESTVKQAADTDGRRIAQQVLPKSLPTIELPKLAPATKPRKRAAKRAAQDARRRAQAPAGAKKRAKRATKRA